MKYEGRIPKDEVERIDDWGNPSEARFILHVRLEAHTVKFRPVGLSEILCACAHCGEISFCGAKLGGESLSELNLAFTSGFYSKFHL